MTVVTYARDRIGFFVANPPELGLENTKPAAAAAGFAIVSLALMLVRRIVAPLQSGPVIVGLATRVAVGAAGRGSPQAGLVGVLLI